MVGGPAGGQFVISIDLEMSWGAVHHGSPHDASPYELEREVVADVLDLMQRYDIAATWATVGHLFLSSCSPEDPAHPEIIRPMYPWLEGDWYGLDPGTDLHQAPTWYGSDLVEAIRNCSTEQEIGSHSFAHIIAGDPACSREAFESDIRAAVGVADEAGIELRSFVYPRNSFGHVDVLAEAGFTAYRGATPQMGVAGPAWLRRVAGISETVWPRTTYRAVREGSMINIPHTYLFDPGSKTAQRYGTALWSRLVQRRLRHAVRTGSLFHLWFHSHNLAVDLDRSHTAMEGLFALARREIDAGRLTNPTMGQLAERLLAEPSS